MSLQIKIGSTNTYITNGVKILSILFFPDPPTKQRTILKPTKPNKKLGWIKKKRNRLNPFH